MTEQPSDDILEELQQLLKRLAIETEVHDTCDGCPRADICKFKEIQMYFHDLKNTTDRDGVFFDEWIKPSLHAIEDEVPLDSFAMLARSNPIQAYSMLASAATKAGFYTAIKAIRAGAITPIEIQP